MVAPVTMSKTTAQYHFKKPGRGATLITFICILLLAKLGLWQHQRLAWKTDLLDRIQTGISAAPIPLPDHIDKKEDWEYRTVSLSGSFAHDKELYIQPRTLKDQAGGHVVTPFHMDNGDTVLVNRGWIPHGKTDYTRPTGHISLTANIRFPYSPTYFTPENNPAKNNWYWMDNIAISEHLDLETRPLLLFATAGETDAVFPIGGQLRTYYPNDHFGYMVFWFGMIPVLLVIYILSHITRTAPTKKKDTV